MSPPRFVLAGADIVLMKHLVNRIKSCQYYTVYMEQILSLVSTQSGSQSG